VKRLDVLPHKLLRKFAYIAKAALKRLNHRRLGALHALVDKLLLHDTFHWMAVLIDGIFPATGPHVRGLCRASELLAVDNRGTFLRAGGHYSECRHQRRDH